LQETEPEINARIDRETTEQLKREYPEMPYQGGAYGYEEQPNPTSLATILGMLALSIVTVGIIFFIVWAIGG